MPPPACSACPASHPHLQVAVHPLRQGGGLAPERGLDLLVDAPGQADNPHEHGPGLADAMAPHGRLGVVGLPRNYEIFYEALSGANPALGLAVVALGVGAFVAGGGAIVLLAVAAAAAVGLNS